MNINGNSIEKRLSIVMKSVVLSTTGLSNKVRKEICEKAYLMGAVVDSDLSDMTTHLVCTIAKGAKHGASLRPPLLGHIYVVTPEYVRHCHAHVTRLDERKYSMPALSGLQVSLSGFEKASRVSLQQTITSLGATYAPTLDANTTDVLIARRAFGAKYDAAISWKVPCVPRKWLDDCVAAGRRQDAYNYVYMDSERKRKRTDWRYAENQIVELDRVPFESDIFDEVIAFIAETSLDTAKINSLLSCGQGTRFPFLATAVTHIIVSPNFKLKDCDVHWARHVNSAHVVRADWITTSTISRRRQPEHLFPPR
mmetsp:Transcript_9216/g.27583  ORF Transcript_9216/g.27583 Transcript_9216/m.27583 type:complete len:310 (-) Transcript_9216:81-1010(-)|eukprot:CAMPEP_0119275554 /NCGR_PEP_ID=MMETSP1329-20130426/13948_1 /TAXON_ID=114041 /ORGANISM="Genus nov. species nov., Strain RCC1024" /LENGTH=309 /DNA_ID=CAMNT_0007275939 /DNA_START=327 /DNA_END=1256 /DNA_ORIENTATION=+